MPLLPSSTQRQRRRQSLPRRCVPFRIRELLDGGLLHTTHHHLGKACARTARTVPGETASSWCKRARHSCDRRFCARSPRLLARGRHRAGQGNLAAHVMKVSPSAGTNRGSACAGLTRRIFHGTYKPPARPHDLGGSPCCASRSRAPGMPELHALTPSLTNLQTPCRHVALVTAAAFRRVGQGSAGSTSRRIFGGRTAGRVRDGASSACAPAPVRSPNVERRSGLRVHRPPPT